MGKASSPPACETCCQYNSQKAAEAKIKDKTCEKAYQNDNKICWYIKCDTDFNHSNGTVIPKTLWNNFESIGKELLWGLSAK